MQHFIRFFSLLFVFFFTLFLMPYYFGGDLKVYKKAFESITELSFFQAYFSYIMHLHSTKEFGHFVLTWIASHFLSKDVFIAISNALFAFYTMKLFSRLRVNFVIATIFILTNYYMIILYFPAERLKFAMLFFVLSLLNISRKKYFFIFSFLTIITHATLLIFYISYVFYYFMKRLKRLFIYGKASKPLLFFLVILSLSSLVMLPHIIQKLSYLNTYAFSPFLFLKITIFTIVLFFYTKKKSDLFFILLPFYGVILLINDDSRINMFVFMIFFYFMSQVNRGVNIPMIVVLLYFSLKTYPFIMKIITYGNGFL